MKLTKAMRKAVFSEMGKAGAAARAKNLTPARRKAIAKQAIDARWAPMRAAKAKKAAKKAAKTA